MHTDNQKGDPTIIRINFQDRGQDFLWWDIELMGGDMGKVIDCGPFQASVWVGYYVFSGFKPRCKVRYSKGPDAGTETLKYHIRSVEFRYPKHEDSEDPPVVGVGEKYMLGLRGMDTESFYIVKPKSENKEGRWVNVLDSVIFPNQIMKDNAISRWREGAYLLRLGWLNPATFEIEVP